AATRAPGSKDAGRPGDAAAGMSGALPFLVALAAVALDLLFGEPRRGHPLVAFGRLARWLEARLHRDSRASGALAWSLAVLPCTVVAATVQYLLWTWSPWAALAWASLALYAAL